MYLLLQFKTEIRIVKKLTLKNNFWYSGLQPLDKRKRNEFLYVMVAVSLLII